MKKDDSFGVELDLNITKFKNKFKEATTISTEFAKKIEKTRHFGQNAFGDIVELKEFSDEIANQNRLYAEQQKILSSISKLNRNKLALSNLGTTNLTEGNNYSGYIASFKKATVEEKKEIKELNNEIEDTGKVTKQAGTEISTAFNKGLKSVKKLTLGFLGARSAFSLFRKYMSEYSSENEVFAQKMQLTTSVIANTLAPAFEFFGNIVQYVVIGLARVVELLFGVNILGKTMDKSLKGASKSAKELNDNLSGLDEISNIDQSASGLSTGIGGQLEALNDFKKKIEEVKKLFKKWGVEDKVKAVKEFLEDLWNSQVMQGIRNLIGNIVDWAVKHPNAVATILGGTALIGLISKIMGTAGGTGLLGLVSNLQNLKMLGPIAISITVAYLIKQKTDEWIGKQADSFEQTADDFKKSVERGREKITEAIEEGNKNSVQQIYENYYKTYDKNLSNLSKTYEKINNPIFRFLEKMNGREAELQKADEGIKKLQESMKELYSQTKLMYDSNLLNDDEIQNFKQLVGTQIKFAEQIGYTKKETSDLIAQYLELNNSAENLNIMVGYMKDLGYTEDEIREKLQPYFDDLYAGTDTANDKIGDMGKDVYEIFAKDYKLNIKTDDTEIKNTKSKISSIFSNPFKLIFNTDTSSIKSALTSAFSGYTNIFKFLGIKLPSYDVGTDYVPRDQIAMIHEGERIVPKKYNNSRYMGNEETNSLLIELNRNVLELANKPSILNVNGKELARATYSDYQEEGSRRGSNLSIRRS